MSRVIAPEDVRAVLASPLVMTATDTYAVDRPLDPSMALHPRTYAAYPRFLARHIREHRLMPLPEAVWRMTGYPAERFRLKDCGRLVEGRAADSSSSIRPPSPTSPPSPTRTAAPPESATSS